VVIQWNEIIKIMGLEKNCSRVFVRKPYDKQLYKWSPPCDDKKIKKQQQNVKFYCDALPRTQGEDWVVSYVYELTSSDGVQHRFAYVACDYVR